MKRSRTRRLGAEARLILALWVAGLLGAALHTGAQALFDWRLGSALVALMTLVMAVASAGYFLKPWHAMFRALSGLVASYRDGDFSIGIARTQDGALGELIDAHNELGCVLREQRLHLVQRELLLDTMVQHTPVSMVLLDPSGYVVYGNPRRGPN